MKQSKYKLRNKPKGIKNAEIWALSTCEGVGLYPSSEVYSSYKEAYKAAFKFVLWFYLDHEIDISGNTYDEQTKTMQPEYEYELSVLNAIDAMIRREFTEQEAHDLMCSDEFDDLNSVDNFIQRNKQFDWVEPIALVWVKKQKIK
jgi:hypothetical protein